VEVVVLISHVFLYLVAKMRDWSLEHKSTLNFEQNEGGDGIWFFQYHPKSKQQSLQWKQPTSPQPKKVHMSKYK
jgi:hypothetical protein